MAFEKCRRPTAQIVIDRKFSGHCKSFKSGCEEPTAAATVTAQALSITFGGQIIYEL